MIYIVSSMMLSVLFSQNLKVGLLTPIILGGHLLCKPNVNMSSNYINNWLKTHLNLKRVYLTMSCCQKCLVEWLFFFKVPPQGGAREVRGWINCGHHPHRELHPAPMEWLYPSFVFRKILEVRSAVKMGTFEKSDRSLTDPGSDTLNNLLNTHGPTATPIQPTVYDTHKSVPKSCILACMPSWLTTDKLLLALKQFQNKKYPGPDGLRPIALKHLPQKCIKLLQMLYKASILFTFTLERLSCYLYS